VADARVGVIRRRVVGAAAAYTLARRGVTSVLLEAEVEFGLATSGTNSGIVHTSIPCELKTEFILRDAELRAVVFGQSGKPVCQSVKGTLSLIWSWRSQP